MAARKSAKVKKKPKKLGFKIVVMLPPTGKTRKADVSVLTEEGLIAATDRVDLGDGRERTWLANKFTKNLHKGTSEQWEAALQQAYCKALTEQQSALQREEEDGSPPGSPYSPCAMYRIEAGRMCMTRHTAGGEEIVIPLCNFVASVTEALRIDDGSGEIEQHFTVEGTLDNETLLAPAIIRASEFVLMNWPVTSWGLSAIVTPGQGCRDHLRAAIQWFSQKAVQRTVFKHTGWRQVNGEWVYLHAGGAISARGLITDVAVQLDAPLDRYSLPVPPIGEHLHNAVRSSLRLLMLSLRLMAPILGTTYRSVLGPVDCSLHVVGHTGVGKSEITALGQQHFGCLMNRLNLPASWQSTGNSLERFAFLAKDAVLAIDDFKPGGSKSDIDRMHQLADRVLRAQGNRSGRARCRSDGTPKAPQPPRGLILSSGEDMPRGKSLQARLLTLRVAKGDLDLRALTPYQQDAADGLYAAAMAAFLCWLAPRYDATRASLDHERAVLRDKAVSGGHARTPGIIADIALGWKYFLDFAVDSGAITSEEREVLATEVWASLTRTVGEHIAEIVEQDPARRFLRLLNAVITSGRAHITDRDGLEPPSSAPWGWQLEPHGTSTSTSECRKPQGKQVGWMDGDDLYVDPESAFAEVQRLGEDQGERLTLSKQQVYRRLKESDLLLSFEQGKTTTRRTLQGRERAVLHLSVDSLTSPKQGEQGEQGAEPAAPKAISPDGRPNPPIPPVSGKDEVVL